MENHPISKLLFWTPRREGTGGRGGRRKKTYHDTIKEDLGLDSPAEIMSLMRDKTGWAKRVRCTGADAIHIPSGDDGDDSDGLRFIKYFLM